MKKIVTLITALLSVAHGMTEAEFDALYKRTDKDAEACYKLYEAYRDGDGVEKDSTKARKWLLGAHKLGKPVYNEIATLPWRKASNVKPGRLLTPKYKVNTIREKGDELSKATEGDHPDLLKVINENPKGLAAAKQKLVRSLLADGADPNHRSKKANVPLAAYCDAEFADLKTIKMFIEAGADVHAHDSAAIDRACSNSRSDEAPKDPKYKAIYQKRKKAHAAKIAFLLKNGLDVTMHDTSGATMMCIAAFRGNAQTIELFAKAGADPNARCNKYEIAGLVSETTYYDTMMGIKEGNTPLHFCVGMPYVSKIETLLKYGADPEIANEKGETPIDYLNNRLKEETRPEYRAKLEEVKKLFDDAIEAKKNPEATQAQDAPQKKAKSSAKKNKSR